MIAVDKNALSRNESDRLSNDDDELDLPSSRSPAYTRQPKLTPRQTAALECLISRRKGESMDSVAQRAGVTRKTIYLYLQLPHFDAAYRKRIKAELSSYRSKMASALVEAGSKVGMPGQTAAQKLYWQLIGDLKESIEVSGPDGQPISVQTSPALLSRLSVDLKRRIVEELEQIRKEDERIAAERDKQEDRVDDRTIDVTPEQQKALPTAIEETEERT